ncbi:Uncharacterized protein FKW44_024521, partial [Caligus rogercresseyi]
YFSEDEDAIRRVTIPKPGEGEKLGVTVIRSGDCVVVTRILAGGLAESNGLIDIGDIILEINNIPIHSPEDLMALVSMSDKRIHFLVKKTPENELVKYGIPNTPSLRKAINEKSNLDQRVLCHAGLTFNHGDAMRVLDGGHIEEESSGLVPSLELEERRKAFKKKKSLFRASKSVAALDKAELQLYEEIIVIVGASVMGRRTLKTRIINGDPSSFGAAHSTHHGPSGQRRIAGRAIGLSHFIEYGSYNGHYYGTKLDSIRDIIKDGRTCVFDCGVAAMKLLRNSTEFMPTSYSSRRRGWKTCDTSTRTLVKTLANFERTSSIRSSSRRAKTLDLMKNLEESARLQRAFGNYFDFFVVEENRDDTFRSVMEALHCSA